MAITIAELLEKGKYFISYGRYRDDLYLAIILLGVALGGFACGRLSLIEERSVPVAIEKVFSEACTDASAASSLQKVTDGEAEEGRAPSLSPGAVVASKNGKRYHLPWCSGAQTIKEENKIWFASETEAQTAGYTKAGNCR